MSRSRPTVSNPSTRWHEWDGKNGNLKYYDKEKGENVPVKIPFTFLLLDELAKVGGFNEEQQKGIYSNEVHYVGNEPLSVRIEGNLVAEGLYSEIKEDIKSSGGHYISSLYIAYKDDSGDLQIGNLALKGAALSSWMDFSEEVGQMRYEQAIRINGYSEDTYDSGDGEVTFRYPTFELQDVKAQTHEKATALDAELQDYFDSKPKQTQPEPAGDDPYEGAKEPGAAAMDSSVDLGDNFDDIEDDLPF